MLHAESPVNKFPAYIDVDEKFNATDKLSMVNTLVQMENVASYAFMGDLVRDGKTHIHAFWFDIYTGDIYYFSRRRKVILKKLQTKVLLR
jgi:carbonic anhydrase